MENHEDDDDEEDLDGWLVLVSETDWGLGGRVLVCVRVIEHVIPWAGGQRVLRPCVPADIGVHLSRSHIKRGPLCDPDDD